MRPLFAFTLTAAALCFASTVAIAAPSGGPYGPIRQTYALPETTGTIYYVAPHGDAASAGTSLESPTTLDAVITRVVTNDAVILRGGDYRTGNLVFNQGITMQPYADEVPVIKGTRQVTADEAVLQRNLLWRVKWDTLFPLAPQSWWRRESSGNKTPLWLFNNDMVFVDGEALRTVGWEGDVDEKSFYVDYDNGEIYFAADPSEHLVEITVFDNAITRTTGEVHGKKSDRMGPVLRGLTFKQYAYRAIEIEGTDPEGLTPESEFGKDVVGTTLEHVTISHCSRVAGYFRGDNMVFRHCLISDTSTEGIFILSSNDALLEKNVFSRNNVEGIHGYFPAVVKVYNQNYRTVIRDNLVIDNENSEGFFVDVGNVDTVFVNNWIENSANGFFIEISHGGICAGNVFVNCLSGVQIRNAADVRVFNNTFINSNLFIIRDTRSPADDHWDWHASTGPAVDKRFGHQVANNLFIEDGSMDHPFVRVEQASALVDQLKDPQVDLMDYNVYVRQAPAGQTPLMFWAPAPTADGNTTLATLAELRAIESKFEKHSVFLDNYQGRSVRSIALRRFDLLDGFVAGTAAGPIPADIAKLIDRSTAAGGSVGAD